MKTIEIAAKQYEDSDDCFAAAVEDYIDDHPEAGAFDLNPRWKDEERDIILLDVPCAIEIEMDSPNGPRVIVTGKVTYEDVYYGLPPGFKVHQDDWMHNGVTLAEDVTSYSVSGPWYTCREGEGEEMGHFRADSWAEAEETAEDWLAEADYNLELGDRTFYVSGTVYLIGDEKLRRDGHSVYARIDPPEPKCARAEGHEWGDAEGMRGHGGGVLYSEPCLHCAIVVHTDTWHQDGSGRQGLRAIWYQPTHDGGDVRHHRRGGKRGRSHGNRASRRAQHTLPGLSGSRRQCYHLGEPMGVCGGAGRS